MNARFISIMGVKDGVGASTFALELALVVKKNGGRVLLLDTDPEFSGDLAKLCGDKNSWRTLRDLQKIPKPIDPQWLYGFLKSSAGVSSLALQTKESCAGLDILFPFFDTIIADVGSRWHAAITPLLEKSSSLLFVLNAAPPLVEALRVKRDSLIQNYYPLSKAGWVAWRWDPQSFLSVEAVSDFSKIPCFGKTVEEVFPSLENCKTEVVAFNRAEADFDEAENRELKLNLLLAVQKEMEARGLKTEKGEENLRPKISKIILEVLESKASPSLLNELLDEILGLGPLEPLMAETGLSEILVNGPESIYVEQSGKLQKTAQKFLNTDSLHKVIERILLPVGRRVDESSPMVDARLQDGSRVNIILPPLALNGPVISIRRFSKQALKPADLIRLGAASETLFQFLEEAVRTKKNILVSGGTGSGKTTLLNALSSFIPEEERIITIEDAAELRLNQPHVVRLESRPANIEGKGAITIRDLVRNALRMRPDRIVVGECRGGEALDMLQAMNTGHEGSLTTLHANAPRDALSRLETLVMFAGMELPSRVVREQIASAIDLIVQTARQPNGERKITQVSKMSGMEGEVFLLEDLFGGLA